MYMSEEETCKECSWLVPTKFKKYGKNVYYCNNLNSKKVMEKHEDFIICGEFDKK